MGVESFSRFARQDRTVATAVDAAGAVGGVLPGAAAPSEGDHAVPSRDWKRGSGWKRQAPHLAAPIANGPGLGPQREAFLSPTGAYCVLAVLVFAVLAGLWASWPSASHDDTAELASFRRTYLVVWTVAISTDWLQGPYVYALYQQFGFSHDDIATIYLVGFLTASVMGVVLGPVTDRFGRKLFAGVYCFLTASQCVTKHFASYWILMLGRFLGGCASCLLFTAFESWMVAETTRRGFSDQALKYIFGCKELLSSIVAIAAGLIAQFAACGFTGHPLPVSAPIEGSSLRLGGYVTPFDVVICVCCVCGLLTRLWWTENYGSQDDGVCRGFGRALGLLRETRVLLIGLVVALFESAMFLWVFIWTPALTKAGYQDPPYAIIFASFMAAKMAGSQIFTFLSTTFLHTATILVGAMVTATASHLWSYTLIRSLQGMEDGSEEANFLLMSMLISFVLFELAVGVYWPAAGMLKAQIVPESCRATMYNLYRLPLNAIVATSLLCIDKAPATLLTTGALLCIATALAVWLWRLVEPQKPASKPLLAADPESVGLKS